MNNNTNKKNKKKKQATSPKTRSRPKTRSPPKTKTPQTTKTTHEIKRPIVKLEEVERYLQHIQHNPDLDEFPMNKSTIRTQIAECEVAYYKIRHTNPVLAKVDMEFYHSLPPVQVPLGEMTRLESLTAKLEANNIETNTNTTISTTPTHTADRPQLKIHTDKDTIGTTESNSNNNNNNKTSDNPTTANNDKRIIEQARETKRHYKQAIEKEQAWH